ncbi:MAG: hypothetical protein OEO23_16495, partial [Gemmatimonadota bacterium]|nr:hypothetical protein [Gemmatimonadota bacterium]
MRLGYAELKVKPEVKRLQVAVTTDRAEYRPRDTVAVELAVEDAQGRGQRSEVTLWAVDEGVLALTGYRTPDPLDLLYPRRGLGMYLASNLVAVAPQVPEGQKASVAPGGGGGGEANAILRSRFKTTAFFLGSVETGPDGRAQVTAALPDNLTTFRLMAVAVTPGDRYGSGDTEFLVSLPLLARPALPRFVRPTDRFEAGVVVNSRLPGAAEVGVSLEAQGIEVTGAHHQSHSVEPLGGADVRFGFLASEGDSATFTFSVEGEGEADAVRVGVPVEPMAYPIVATTTGVLNDPVSTAIIVDGDIDFSRAQVEISFGSSPLAFVRGVQGRLRVYSYYCSEQVSSRLLPLIALERAGARVGTTFQEDASGHVAEAVRILTERQQPTGGIGYWREGSWTTPTVTAYAGRVLLEAKAAGFEVQDSVLTRIGDYLAGVLSGDLSVDAPMYRWWWSDARWRLGESVHAADFLSRVGRPDIPTENSLLQNAANLTWDARLRLAEMLARRGEVQPARGIITQALAGSRIEGRQLILSDDVEPGDRGYGYFHSRIGHVARLVEALMVVDPGHPSLGPAVERLVGGTRARANPWWTTYDQGQAILALVRYDESVAARGPRRISAMIGGTPVDLVAGGSVGDTTLAVADLMGGTGRVLPVYLERSGGTDPIYYYITLSGPPPGEHPDPSGQGLEVERWYEDP